MEGEETEAVVGEKKEQLGNEIDAWSPFQCEFQIILWSESRRLHPAEC